MIALAFWSAKAPHLAVIGSGNTAFTSAHIRLDFV